MCEIWKLINLTSVAQVSHSELTTVCEFHYWELDTRISLKEKKVSLCSIVKFDRISRLIKKKKNTFCALKVQLNVINTNIIIYSVIQFIHNMYTNV